MVPPYLNGSTTWQVLQVYYNNLKTMYYYKVKYSKIGYTSMPENPIANKSAIRGRLVEDFLLYLL